MQSVNHTTQQNTMSRIYLRGVDLLNLVERYMHSEFVHLKTPLKVDNSVAEHAKQNVITLEEDIGHKPYILDIGAGQNFICLGYKVYDKEGNYGPLDPEQFESYNCMNCLMPFEYLTDTTEVMGIPVKREIKTNEQGQTQYIYHMVDIFCCMRCMYAEYKKRSNNKLYTQSEALISDLWVRYTGRSPAELKPASDCRILEIFNGPMNWKEYHKDTVRYQRPENVFFIPTGVYLPNSS